MKSRHLLVWVLGFTVFAMNPALACYSSGIDEFEYGEAEMMAAVEGTWQVTFARPEETSAITFRVERGTALNGALAAPFGLTPQCETRTFTRPAGACSPTSQLALTANIVDAAPPLDATEGKGWYTVHNVKYTGGRMMLTFGASFVIEAYLTANNEVWQSDVTWQGSRLAAGLTRVTK
jgi:hypothetical protein